MRSFSFFLVIFIQIFLLFSPARAVLVSSVGALQTAVNNANSGGDKTILIADGTYDLTGRAFYITADNVTVRSASGNRGAVVLDNHYDMGGTTSGIFRIVSSGVTISDMTLKRPYYHAIHISPAGNKNTGNILLKNLHIIDPGEQAIKINANSRDNATYSVRNSVIRDSLIELTNSGRRNLTNTSYPCYTGGIDGHWASNWTVQDNTVKGFWCSDGLSEHGIHFWNNSSDILVQRNAIIDCDRGIGFGLGSDGNVRGIIRNNMIYHGPDHGFSDVGIGIESTSNAKIYNNTIFHVHNYSAIEYRFSSTTNVLIKNNLTNRPIARRDGASGTVANNITNAGAAWFVDAGAGDLHLKGTISSVIDKAQNISGLIDDLDQDKRPQGQGYDIGADEATATESKGFPWLHLLLRE